MKQNKELLNEYDLLMQTVKQLPLGIIALTMEGYIQFINTKSTEYLEISEQSDRLKGENIFNYLKEFKLLKQKLEEALKENGNSFNIEKVRYNNFYLAIRGKPINKKMIITINDITKLKEIESQSILSMLEGQETERNRLAKEIHDGLGPLLSTIKINLEAINMEIDQYTKNNVISKRLDKVYKLIDILAQDMRSISHSLMPKVLEDFGVGPALESLCNHLNEPGKINIHYYDSGFEDRMEKNTELNIYRIAQELLHNAIKHSGGTRVNIQYIKHTASIVLMVEDNGKGFDIRKAKSDKTGIGLKNIETRAKMIGANLFIDSNKDVGVTATLEIPVKK
ncbi:MAG: histidine kinase [Bacteroidales bacterium]